MRVITKLLVSVPVAATLCSFHKDSINFPRFTNVAASEQCLQLEQVQVLFRHGARSSIKNKEIFDNFSNIDAVVWDKEKFGILPSSIGFDYVVKSVNDDSILEPKSHNLIHHGGHVGGDLTTIGFQEAHDFGEWLAKEYIVKHAIVPSLYNQKDLYVRSTISKRAVLTAVGVISGLYGKENLTETVVIHSAPHSADGILPNLYGCKNIHKRFMRHWNTELKEGQEEINTEMGLKEGARPFNYVEIYDVLVQRRHHGLHVPEYLLNKEKEIAKLAMDTMFDILGKNVDELKDSIGSFVDTLCCHIEASVDGTAKTKMVMYPSHDLLIMPFLVALGVFDNEWPPFVGSVIVELYRSDSDERSVRILHNRVPVILDKEYGEFMPLHKFMKLLEDYRVKDWAKQCGNQTE